MHFSLRPESAYVLVHHSPVRSHGDDHAVFTNLQKVQRHDVSEELNEGVKEQQELAIVSCTFAGEPHIRNCCIHTSMLRDKLRQLSWPQFYVLGYFLVTIALCIAVLDTLPGFTRSLSVNCNTRHMPLMCCSAFIGSCCHLRCVHNSTQRH